MDAITPPTALQGAAPPAPDPQAQMAQALTPQPQPTTHDVTIVTTKKYACAKVLGVPPEEFGIERGARDIETCNYAFHEVVTKTEGQLIAEGFDEQQVKELSEYVGNTNVETTARDSVNEHFISSDVNSSARLVKLTEHYVRMDYKGDGKPCLYMVVTGGDQGEILIKDGKEVIEPIDVIPFACTTPVPITHRFFGRSVADLVMPVMREKTALKRGALDNLYLHNNPRVEVAEANAGPNTLDDLLVSRSGGVVRTKTAGGLNWQTVPDITPSVYPMLQYLDAELETRTGLSKQTQGLDANALQNQSATAVAQVFSSSQMRMKLTARVMAEGVRRIFSLLHHTIRSHGQEQATVRLRNKWVPVDPRNWKTRDDMTINVGLGTGGKAQQFAQLMALGNIQKELLAGGKANLVDDTALFNTASEVTKIMGYKNPDRFFNDPTEKGPDGQLMHPPVPPPPDPKVQIEQQKAQNDAQANQQKAALEQQQAQIKSQQASEKAQLDAFHQKVKMEGELQLAREKAQLDKEMAMIDAALKERADQRAHELHQQKMTHAQQLHEHALTQSAQQHGQTIENKQLEHKNASSKTASVDHIKELKSSIEEAANAPIEIIRDKAGKAAAIKRGNKTMMIERGTDGKPMGAK
jgi:hypothetical protein